MSGIVDKLKLKERAEEDLYFARRERELTLARRAHPRPGADRLRVICGGQTGVDRAALEAALSLGLTVDGWCPRGRIAEDGPLPCGLPLRETPHGDPAERTAWNVRDSDATLILHRGGPTGGTALTVTLARRAGRPLLMRDLGAPVDAAEVARWLCANGVRGLNCAGPRESEVPGIQAQAQALLREVFGAWALAPRA